MRHQTDSDPPIDWTLTTWEGSRREQLRRWAALPLDRTLAALEEMGDLAEALGRARSKDSLAGARFWKMSGGGNDFVVFDNRAGWFPKARPELVAALCARGTGIGADAVLLLEHASAADADFRMVYYNADGSEAPMCGNGALCIARFARELGAGAGTDRVRFETGSGPHDAELSRDFPSRVRLAMREPRAVRPSLPEIEARGYARAGFADTGTPHLVALVDDLAGLDVAVEGRALRHHPLFEPEGLNVDFVAVLGRNELAIRTYERGVEAETLSCGTGAAAAAILTRIWGLTEPPVVVHPPGGRDLRIAFEGVSPGDLRALTLEGEARIVFSGRLGEAPVGLPGGARLTRQEGSAANGPAGEVQ